MPRAGLSPAALVELALAELDATDGAPLALGAIASRAGVKTPSIYKHVAGLPELEALVAARIYRELGDALEAALGAPGAGAARGPDAVRAFLRAYRSFAIAHPGRYRWLPVQPGGHPELEAEAARVLAIAGRAVEGASGEAAIHALRGLRAVAHGFATLEAAGGFGMPADVDASYEQLIERLVGD
ncbi:TetR/AcrR family transcriptional regulator [Agrococcus baldri]|uniref:TetR family transcriptional regulator n=1 Tax=Agrococcus baldri TaxID=153730 RepID=A0AA87RCH5_9MICO|nr:TetR-like C-terminal domain-containing protein [Agrococcus baldri]GEK80152.1 TetR family transcriptional regulator [Agrococcus baldri]